MPRSTVPTLLSLHRYAKIMGFDPLHFNQGVSTLRPEVGSCPDIWYEYDWQDNDKVSRSQISEKIAEAEADLAQEAKYWPAPKWIEDERHLYPTQQRVDVLGDGYNARGYLKTVQLDRGYVISGGVRATDYLATDSYTTLDADGDTYEEWAVFSFTITDAQAAAISNCEVHAFFKEFLLADAENCRTDPNSTGADEVWRIRPVYATVSGTTVTVRIPRYELFLPQLQEQFAVEVVDADDPDSYVDEVMFYRVYNDPSDITTFGWANEISCEVPACAWATQTGCIKTLDSRNGLVVPEPGTWDSTDEEYDPADWNQSIEPNLVWINYYAGLVPERSSLSCDLLSDWWARTIAHLATTRLDTKLCTCANVGTFVNELREDVKLVNKVRSFQVTADDLRNPFGTRAGEVEAWQKLKGRGRRRGNAMKF